MRDRAEMQKHTAEMQKRTEANLSALTDIVADLGRAQTQTEKALTRTENAVANLTEMFERHIANGQG